MRIGFVGGGKMAEAMIGALLRARVAPPSAIVASDISPNRRGRLKARYRVAVTACNLDAAKATVVILAVKPQQLGDVLAEVSPVTSPRTLVVSIAAGKRIAFVEGLLPKARVIRVMPNLACQVFEGMSVFCGGSRATARDRRWVARMLSAFGRAVELPEEAFDAVTALSGSGPAFFAFVLDGLADAAVGEGLTRTDALLLAQQTMLGTAKYLMETHADPKDLIASVASAKGTTAAGLAVLGRSSVSNALRRTIRAAAKRSRELSR